MSPWSDSNSSSICRVDKYAQACCSVKPVRYIMKMDQTAFGKGGEVAASGSDLPSDRGPSLPKN